MSNLITGPTTIQRVRAKLEALGYKVELTDEPNVLRLSWPTESQGSQSEMSGCLGNIRSRKEVRY